MLDSPTPFAVFSAILICSTIYSLVFLQSEVGFWRSLLKTLPIGLMASFVGFSTGAGLLALALALSALGDFFLSRTEKSFTAGLVSFLLAHLVYIWIFWHMVEQFALSWGHAVMLIYALFYGAYLWPRTGAHRVPVMLYVSVITLMVSTALMLPPGFELVLLGCLLFALSDSMLALEMFVVSDPKLRPFLSQIVWVSYVAAQGLITYGLL